VTHHPETVAALAKQAQHVGVLIVVFALALMVLAGCGGEGRQREASLADVAGFIQLLVPVIASSRCGDLTEAARELQTSTNANLGDFQKTAEAFQRFADGAPAEIQDDLQALAEPYSRMGEALNAADALEGVEVTKPTPETLKKLDDVTATADALDAGVDRKTMQQATNHIFAWIRVNCRQTR
jgi:hypothetical protein